MLNDWWLTFLVGSFAVYRITRMAAVEEGPFEICFRIRKFLLSHFSAMWVQRGVTCPYCISFYVGLLAALIVYFTVPLGMTVSGIFWLWFAYSGVACFLYGLTQ